MWKAVGFRSTYAALNSSITVAVLSKVPTVVRSLAFFADGLPNFMARDFRLALVTLEWPSEANGGDPLV
jgi:hypothetical protein